MERILQLTSDGSHTIFDPSMEVSYHSKHGAIQESLHVFIEAGLEYQQARLSSHIDILEMGFGTGLNALLTIIAQENPEIRYETLEAYPLTENITNHLNYCEQLKRQDLQSIFTEMHSCDWGQEITITNGFTFIKQKTDLVDFETSHQYDLIYFDAFDPITQPEIWTLEIFRKLYNSLRKNGTMVTYCSKSVVRKALQEAGFIIKKIPGPYGKREMLRAIKTS